MISSVSQESVIREVPPPSYASFPSSSSASTPPLPPPPPPPTTPPPPLLPCPPPYPSSLLLLSCYLTLIEPSDNKAPLILMPGTHAQPPTTSHTASSLPRHQPRLHGATREFRGMGGHLICSTYHLSSHTSRSLGGLVTWDGTTIRLKR